MPCAVIWRSPYLSRWGSFCLVVWNGFLTAAGNLEELCGVQGKISRVQEFVLKEEEGGCSRTALGHGKHR